MFHLNLHISAFRWWILMQNIVLETSSVEEYMFENFKISWSWSLKSKISEKVGTVIIFSWITFEFQIFFLVMIWKKFFGELRADASNRVRFFV
jgi:hypothetical protein